MTTAGAPKKGQNVFARANLAVKYHLGARSCLVVATLATSQLARASVVDSEHLFGFTEGADIGKVGEREAETETIGHFGKSAVPTQQ